MADDKKFELQMKVLEEYTKALARARRVHKLPISCWPTIEGLQNALKSKKLT
jgi:hypothetical protein